MHHQPRVRKNEIPTIAFAEDRLIKKFNRKNPAITAFDRPAPDAEDPRPISQLFVEKQLEAMQEGMTEKEAYAVARAWMLDNGPALFERLSIPEELKDVLKTSPDNIAASALAVESVLQEQLREVRAAFRAYEEDMEREEALSVGGKKYIVGSYRSFMTAEEEDRLRTRAISSEPTYPRGKGYDTDDENASVTSTAKA